MVVLRRLSDNAGAVGSLTQCIKYEDGKIIEKFVDRPKVGYCYRVGPWIAGFFTGNYWTTSEITEILEERENDKGQLEYVKFKTKNSIYECKA